MIIKINEEVILNNCRQIRKEIKTLNRRKAIYRTRIGQGNCPYYCLRMHYLRIEHSMRVVESLLGSLGLTYNLVTLALFGCKNSMRLINDSDGLYTVMFLQGLFDEYQTGIKHNQIIWD